MTRYLRYTLFFDDRGDCSILLTEEQIRDTLKQLPADDVQFFALRDYLEEFLAEMERNRPTTVH